MQFATAIPGWLCRKQHEHASINGDGLHFFVLRKVFFTKVQSKDSEKIQNYGIVSHEAISIECEVSMVRLVKDHLHRGNSLRRNDSQIYLSTDTSTTVLQLRPPSMVRYKRSGPRSHPCFESKKETR